MNLTLPVSGAWRTTAIDLGQWLPGGSADGRNRRDFAVPRGVDQGRVVGLCEPPSLGRARLTTYALQAA